MRRIPGKHREDDGGEAVELYGMPVCFHGCADADDAVNLETQVSG